MITVNWENPEKTIIRLDYFEPIASWDEYQQAVKQSYEMAKTQSHPVHFLHNPGKAPMPSGNAIANIRRAINTTPPNTATVLMVIANDFARRILQVVIKLTVKQKDFYIVSSLEEAHRVIEIKTAPILETV